MYSEMNHASHQQAVAIVILVMVLTISPVIIVLVRHATQTIQVTPWVCVSGTLGVPRHTVMSKNLVLRVSSFKFVFLSTTELSL
jgi:ABC-type dipeptide/oligopeptide/nickel transport system permease subunit